MVGYDYSQKGWYFVTIDCKNMGQWFGEINDIGTGHCPVRTMKLNECGMVAERLWIKISEIYQGIILDEYVVMPNHVHGIIQIKNNFIGTGHCPIRTNTGNYGKLSKIINGYKGAVTKEIRNKLGNKNFEWQRSFFDEIIRKEEDLIRVRKYILENPINF